MPWTLERDGDTVTLRFRDIAATDWGVLFEAVKSQIASGATTFVFPSDESRFSAAALDAFSALVQYVQGSGAKVLRED
jgi:hypothetical protein